MPHTDLAIPITLASCFSTPSWPFVSPSFTRAPHKLYLSQSFAHSSRSPPWIVCVFNKLHLFVNNNSVAFLRRWHHLGFTKGIVMCTSCSFLLYNRNSLRQQTHEWQLETGLFRSLLLPLPSLYSVTCLPPNSQHTPGFGTEGFCLCIINLQEHPAEQSMLCCKMTSGQPCSPVLRNECPQHSCPLASTGVCGKLFQGLPVSSSHLPCT